MRHQFTPNEVRIEGEVAYLKITRRNGDHFEAIIDIDDLGKVLAAGRWTSDPDGYILSNLSRVRLHRLVVDAPEGLVVDHINHLPHDCRKSNLHVTTQFVNMQNRKGPHANSRSGVRGVYWEKERERWRVEVKAHNVKHVIGRFKSLDEAEAAAESARERLHPVVAHRK